MTKFRIEECEGNRPGSYFFEVFAPDGQSFDGERHSLVACGATRAEGRRLALADAKSTALRDCPPDCDCREIEIRTYDIERENGDRDTLILCTGCAASIEDYAKILRSTVCAGRCERCGASS